MLDIFKKNVIFLIVIYKNKNNVELLFMDDLFEFVYLV